MEHAPASTESKAWLAVPTLGSKLSPSMGLLLSVAGYPEPPHTLCGRLRISYQAVVRVTARGPASPGWMDKGAIESQGTLIITGSGQESGELRVMCNKDMTRHRVCRCSASLSHQRKGGDGVTTNLLHAWLCCLWLSWTKSNKTEHCLITKFLSI